ncbi:hypothetical protein Pint_21448 [Pistacia integerrima]|uniref:Uncharacterized protein n=1 Tax=Pistacia integerrima TaxID=434235 RepID=A0ACC0XDD9_9ROSI|nr:hypothetical protein Pint_21448 [Pistacia integerrima]
MILSFFSTAPLEQQEGKDKLLYRNKTVWDGGFPSIARWMTNLLDDEIEEDELFWNQVALKENLSYE